MMLNVFEAVNMTRKERFLGVSFLRGASVMEEHEDAPPRYVRHWDYEWDNILYHDLMQTHMNGDAHSFLEHYKRTTPLPGWKIL
ncbi:hypothetical protein ACFL2T_06440 [Elusimicrobiota bacterium]